MKRLESNLKNMVISMTVITAAAAAILALTYSLTLKPINNIYEKTIAEAISKVIIGDADVEYRVEDPIEENGFVFHKVFSSESQMLGVAVESTVNGFGGPLKVMVGFNPEGDILGYDIVEHSETPGLGAKAGKWFKVHSIIGMNPGDESFDLKKNGGYVDAITAATITSKAFLKAINEAYKATFGFVALDGVSGASTSSVQKKEDVSLKGKWSGIGLNLNGTVNAIVSIKKGKIANIEIVDNGETYSQFASPLTQIPAEAIKNNTYEVDAVSGATYTSNAVKEAIRDALGQAFGERKKVERGESISFVPGTYTAKGKGFGGELTAKVTFSESAVTNIDIISHKETEHVGDVALPIIVSDIIKANGIGVDAVSGASFSSYAVKEAVADAAMQANLNNRDAFFKNTVENIPGETVEDTWDIVVVGGGGAGLFAAAQASQDGNSVLVIEKNAEVGGNTLVSGGQFQSVDHSLVWDPKNPESTAAVGFDGKMHKKVKSSIGCISELKTILNWNEGPFDTDYYKTHEFIAGDIQDLSTHGVHSEYLPFLKDLKQEISRYFAYAEPKLARGVPETDLILFSTTNLHIFQTYYGGLRQSADKSSWIYGDIDLVKQFIEEGEEIKPWMMDMGVNFEDLQEMIVGSLWYRCNVLTTCVTDLDGDGVKETFSGKWGPYVAGPLSVIKNGNGHNAIMRRTSADDLIFENGKVTGVNATMFDGTKVVAHAKKGVIIATGGYSANVEKVLKTNRYWSRQYLSKYIGTTNRSSMRGDGIDMAQTVGAATTGMEYTQLMPLAYTDGQLAFGGVESALFISPESATRYVDECAERDVLSLSAFKFGKDKGKSKGTFIYIISNNGSTAANIQPFTGDVPGKEWGVKGSELEDLFKNVGYESIDGETVKQTIRDYDMKLINGEEIVSPAKKHTADIIGSADKDSKGKYIASTYDLDNANLRVRILAPATHHTMGGLRVDLDRHVLDVDGNVIPGLYAAGEVTGGFFGGNRLGGNALTEVIASGRIAARSANKN